MPNTAYTTLTVIVRDVNDNPPTFLLTPYFFEITEEETGYVVGRRRGGERRAGEGENYKGNVHDNDFTCALFFRILGRL